MVELEVLFLDTVFLKAMLNIVKGSVGWLASSGVENNVDGIVEGTDVCLVSIGIGCKCTFSRHELDAGSSS